MTRRRVVLGQLMKRLIGSLLLLAIVLVLALSVDAYRQLTQPAHLTKSMVLTIPHGTNCAGVAHRLAAHHVFANWRGAWYWRAYGRFTGNCSHLKSGPYRLKPAMSPLAMQKVFENGDTASAKLTIVPGRRFKQLFAKIENDPDLRHTLAGKSGGGVMAAIGHPGEHPEGRFLPETYRFPIGTTDQAFLERAYQAMHKFLQSAWKKRAKNAAVKTPYQALILASIIEKETGSSAERRRISGVFSRRLRRHMRLQSDPTVIYGLSSFGKKLTHADLHHKTPYNTYMRTGLPPTPIATPSRAAIRAALHPKPGKSMYFVAKGNGRHAFSKTLSGQRAAIRKYQK